ncbi:MAG TPA: hypothetical protein VKX17_19515, partial [Planctomycetota bacterium]|nr:hypothetical protein [Planctomycetota bacterium]
MKATGRFVTCVLALLTGLSMGVRAVEDETGPVVNPRVVTIQTTAATEGVSAISQRGALITLDVTERPLKQVLDYLSTISNVNIRVVKEKDNKIPVT